MIRIIIPLLFIALTVYALVSCVRVESDDDMPAGLPKIAWILIILLLQPVGFLAWFTLQFIKRTDGKRANVKKKDKFVAPDDDEEFLFKLNRDIQLEREGRPRENEHLDTTPKFENKNHSDESLKNDDNKDNEDSSNKEGK